MGVLNLNSETWPHWSWGDREGILFIGPSTQVIRGKTTSGCSAPSKVVLQWISVSSWRHSFIRCASQLVTTHLCPVRKTKAGSPCKCLQATPRTYLRYNRWIDEGIRRRTSRVVMGFKHWQWRGFCSFKVIYSFLIQVSSSMGTMGVGWKWRSDFVHVCRLMHAFKWCKHSNFRCPNQSLLTYCPCRS